jgi:hypothetical protein
MCRRALLCPAKVAKESPSTASELPVLAIYKTIINMPAWLYWAINMGLFDRFKSDKAPTQKADAWVNNQGNPSKYGDRSKNACDAAFATKTTNFTEVSIILSV